MSEIRQLPGRPGLFLVVDQRYPTGDEFARVVSDGLGVHVLRSPEGSLSFLAPVIDRLERLVVTDYRCSDPDILQRAGRLRELDFWAPAERELPFDGMLSLESFAGFGRRVRSLPSVSTLQSVYIEGVSDATLKGALGSIRKITLTRGNALTSVPVLTHPGSTRSLFIQGTRRLDLSGLTEYNSLSHLHLAACKLLTGVDGLLANRIESVELEKCASIDDFRSLSDLEATSVNVSGPSPFDEEFKALVASKYPGRWTFHK